MSNNTRTLLIGVFLAGAILAAFWRVSYFDFINYDDPDYVTNNYHVKNGLTVQGIRWAFTTGHAANWHPITWISHMVDIQLFGLKPRWHHVMNLLFHVANTLLLFFVLRRTTKFLWRSAFVSALFAWHPLHVESVAWVAERKDVLSAFFWMLTLAAYAYYVEHPSRRRHLTVVAAFSIGLMAKPMLVTLPFVLLLLDYWPLQRFRQNRPDQEIQTPADTPMAPDAVDGESPKKTALREEVKSGKPLCSLEHRMVIHPLLWEKTILFALAALSSMVTYIAQIKGGTVVSGEAFPLGVRIANAVVSYSAYIGKMIWPNNLAVLYPHQGMPPAWRFWGAFALLTMVTVMVFRSAKRFQFFAVGWLWYIGTLIPVIGIIQVGSQARADRYTYIPLIGLFIITAWGVPELVKKWRYHKEALVVSSAVILICLFSSTWTQVGYWRNSITLYDHTLRVTDNNVFAHNNRGNAYSSLGNYPQAIDDYTKAIEIDPYYAQAYDNRGIAYAYLGNNKQAIEDYTKAVEINPDHAEAYYDRGNAYLNLGNHRKAIENYDRSIEINQQDARAYMNRGIAHALLGDYGKAIEDITHAITVEPTYAEAYSNRGNAYALLGNERQASEDLKRSARMGYEPAQSALKRQGIPW